ncbi:transmembrane amino acid transporter protein-like protein [Leishmania mexicana MHOM/GT/2001/U1103]|uniref:Transmembrane amino acid transporter protein-like protein n=1 Tax=Leishmania mexicana (strain MHOM/GT/2001/U1103) TaxID=929439 RepID=E9ATN2_LEIMU|nr:transmembrane amino acid transporter protein-like protein [Leishmania mexicana MHOM/GT/2001/U1103]CBZ26306.1 transmembrane amino acid transporter protein-like protein [Leishmania mexicana MHOM/GT/2001/U1103]
MQPFAARSSLLVHDVRASQRQSFAGRISHRVASRLSFAGPPLEERTGTVTGTVINTLCSVIGAGVLSLPLALYFSSIVVGLVVLLVFSSFAAFSVYCLVVGCDATGRYSLTEVIAFALYPPQLWEEYLRKQGTVKETTRKGGEQQAAGQQHMPAPASCGVRSSSRNRESDVTTPQQTEAATTSADARQHSDPGKGVASDEKESEDTLLSRYRHGNDGYGRRRHDGQSCAEASQKSGRTERDPEASFLVPSTSTYARLRDAYAREEWHRRRYRRVITALMELIVFCSNYGTLVIYSKVIADSMPPVVSYVTHTDGFLVTKYFWLITGGVVFFVLSCSRNMEELKWSSLLGFLTILYIVFLILYRYHTQKRYDYPHVDPGSYGKVHWLRFSVGVLQTISTFGLALSYHYNVPYLYKELQDRRPYRMMQSLVVAFPIVVACYAVTGVVGYLTFGNQVAAPKVGGNIVSNYPKKDFLMNIGRLGLFVHFACVFPVLSICTRRGLHRLTMIALTWAEQSALMMEAARASGVQLTEAEQGAEVNTATVPSPSLTAVSRSGSDIEDGAQVCGHISGERSPLLQRRGIPTPGYEAFANSSPPHLAIFRQQCNAESPPSGRRIPAPADSPWDSLCSDASGAEQAHASQPGSGQLGTVDVDRDVGSPDQTTMLAIVIEAAFLVITSVLIAATVSGIDFVIHLIGTLFSIFIVMVAPGMVGWCVFSPSGPFGSASAAVAAYSGGDGKLSGAPVSDLSSRFQLIRLKQLMCLLNALLGVCVTCVGIATLVYETFWGKPIPAL